MAAHDDLEDLVPPAADRIVLGGEEVGLAPLTVARLAAARRFGRRFAAALQSDDLVEALDAEGAAVWVELAAATGIAEERIAAASADGQLALAFRLVREVRDFTEGPLTAAIDRGITELTAGPKPAAGASSSPGSSAAAIR